VKIKIESYLPGFKALSRRANGTRHGGDLARGKRKTFRPIDPKRGLHVVMRSSKARGEFSLLHSKHCNTIEKFVHQTSRRWGVRIYRYANVGNHIHLLIQVPTREAWKRFSKELSGGIAQIVTGARKGAALPRKKAGSVPESAQRAFWDHLLFTRIVTFGRDFEGMKRYLIKNLFEAAGIPMKKLIKEGVRLIWLEGAG
jgi:REP element-mobilizing transposase RayT